MKLTTNAIAWMVRGFNADPEADAWLEQIKERAHVDRHVLSIDIADEGVIDVHYLTRDLVFTLCACGRLHSAVTVRRRIAGTVPPRFLSAFTAIERAE